MLTSILENPRVIAVRVTSEAQNGFLSGGDESRLGAEGTATLVRSILFEGQKVGSVHILYDSRAEAQGANGLWTEIATALAAQLAVSALIIFLIVRMFMNQGGEFAGRPGEIRLVK